MNNIVTHQSWFKISQEQNYLIDLTTAWWLILTGVTPNQQNEWARILLELQQDPEIDTLSYHRLSLQAKQSIQ